MDYRNTLSAAALVVAVGFLVHGYPTANADIGPVVATGANPLVHATGSASGSIFTAPSDQILVVSDIILTASGASGWQPCSSSVELSTPSGDLALFRMTADSTANEGASHPGSTVSHSFAGGLPVASGEQVSIAISGSCTVNYVISGYHAHQ